MNKLFTKIAALCLGATMAVGVGVAVASTNNAKAAYAAISDSEASGLTVLTSANFDSSAEYVLKSTDGYYWNGVSGTSSNKWGGITKTLSDVARVTISGTWADGFTIKDSSNNYLRATTSNMTWATTQAGTFKMGTDSSSNPIVYNGTTNGLKVNGTSGIRLYTNLTYNATTGKSVALYKIPATKTLSSISVSGYTTEFNVGDAFSFGGTVTATYSGGTTANVTSSATFSGYNMSVAGNYTVTASYTEGGTTKTADYSITVSAPTTPYITPAKNSTSGYTGQNESLSFTYGNLTGSLSVTSSNTSVVTVGTPSYSAGSGTVQINFVAVGSTTVKFKDGSTELASVSVSVAASSVTITGLAATSTAYIGKTLNLGSTVNVTATGIYSNAVTWKSEDDDIAIVSATGVVTGVAEGTVDITVTSDDYPSANMTCAVTVEAAPIADLLRTNSTSLNYTKNSYGDVSGVTKTGHSDITSEATYAGYFMCATSPNTGAIQMNPSKSTYICTTASSQLLNSISLTFINANSKGVAFYGSNTAYTASYTAYGSVSGTELGVLTANGSFNVSGDYKYLYIVPTGTTYVGSIEVTWRAAPQLSSVTTSGQTASFTAGVKFSYGGTLTAHYTAGKADATVSPASFKFGASGINPTTAGTAITTNDTLSVATHNGKYIYVIYTEDTITKWASYQITVNYAAVTSVEIDTHTAEIGLGKTYNVTSVGVTVETEYANQGYEWLVSANTVSNDYTWDGTKLTSGETQGTITLRCRSTADNSKYDELVVTVTGDPAVDIIPASVSGYVGKSVDVDFTYGNIDNEELIRFASSDESVLTVGDHIEDSGEGLVTINFEGAGNATLSVSYNGGSTLDSITVTVSTDSVTALTWSAPTIKVYSGATTTVSNASSWNVHYTMASGDEDDLSYGEYTLKLGGSSITLPHTWDASEDGKVLSIEYGGFASPTTSTVNVTQTLQAVMAPVEGEPTTSTLTFTEKYSEGGATSNDGEEWTVVSDAASGESNFDSTKGIHYGTGTSGTGNVTYITLTTSDFGSGNISQIIVNASTASGVTATVGVTVGGVQFGGDPQSLSSSATNYTFTGSAAADEIIVTITKPSNAAKALYCKSIAVTYAESSGTQNIANVAGHEAAQKAVVAFAKAMNAAFDNTANCTDGVAAAWATASNAYSSNIANNASLSADEKAYAKNLIKYASAQYTEHTDNDYSYCLERAMATYEACIQKHGQTAFMSDVRSVSSSPRIASLSLINDNGNTVAIIVIISMISVTCIGGYFFLRKRKEN